MVQGWSGAFSFLIILSEKSARRYRTTPSAMIIQNLAHLFYVDPVRIFQKAFLCDGDSFVEINILNGM